MMSLEKVDREIKSYIETEILPRYGRLKGHTDTHIRQVIKRSLEFAKQVPEVNIDMVYVIAAFHDLGRLVDDETHNIESAKMLRADEFLRERFSDSEIKTMAEAVEDHRASLGREPRSVYGKIVSSADRSPDINDMLERCYDCKKLWNPGLGEDEVTALARRHMRKKYAPDGYAAKTMYFKDPEFEKMLVEVEKITRTPEGFAKIQKEFNERRGKNRT